MTLWISILIAVGLLASALVLRAGEPPKRGQNGDTDIQLVREILLAEAAGEGRGGITRVAEVVRTRCGYDHRGKVLGPVSTAARVVTKPKQFSCFNGHTRESFLSRRRPRVPAELHDYAESLARALVLTPSLFHSDLACGATHYHAAGVLPHWARGRVFVHTFHGHVFYKL